jgi:hypothetical protein
MSDTLTRPGTDAGAPRRSAAVGPTPKPRPRVFVGIAMAIWTALLGLACLVCLTLAAWVTADHHDDAVRPALSTAVQAWLLAQHVSLAMPGGALGIVPLGLTAVLAGLLVRSGRQAARFSGATDRLDCLTTAFAVALPYGVVAALLTRPAQSGQVRAAPLQALACAFVLAFVCVGFGALRETALWQPLIALIPDTWRLVLRAGAAAAATVVGCGAGIVAVGLVTHAKRAGGLTGSLHGGVTGAVLMAVISMAYLPNVVAWASAFSLGPGFAVGAKTLVALGGVHLGAVPALPLLAPLPDTGPVPPATWLLLFVPVLGGVVAGWLLSRARPSAPGPTPFDLAWGSGCGVVCGALMGGFAWLSAGPLGPGRMAHLGPSAWQVGLAAAVEIGVVAGVTSWLLGWRQSRVPISLDPRA